MKKLQGAVDGNWFYFSRKSNKETGNFPTFYKLSKGKKWKALKQWGIFCLILFQYIIEAIKVYSEPDGF